MPLRCARCVVCCNATHCTSLHHIACHLHVAVWCGVPRGVRRAACAACALQVPGIAWHCLALPCRDVPRRALPLRSKCKCGAPRCVGLCSGVLPCPAPPRLVSPDLASPGIVELAERLGFYRKEEGEFDFTRAYGAVVFFLRIFRALYSFRLDRRNHVSRINSCLVFFL